MINALSSEPDGSQWSKRHFEHELDKVEANVEDKQHGSEYA